MTFQIGGNLARSFSSSFSRATTSLSDLRNQSRQTQRSLDQLGNNFRRGSITQSQYAESTARLTRELRQLENAQNRIETMHSLGNGANTVRQAAGIAAIGTAAVASATALSSVKKSMNFEAQLSSIEALTGASNKEMARMHDLSLEMGASTKYSALEAAQGIEELLKAGISPAKVEAGALEAALNLATAGGLELSEAAETMSTALNAFSKDGMTAAQASNILAGTANASATSVHELQYSLSMVSAVAAGAGLSFEDTNAALGVFANKGLKGSDAGTSLKTMLLNLSPITKTQTKLFEKLGITTKKGSNEFYDARGNIKSMAEIAEVLHTSLKHLTNEERQTTMKEMFGTDAIRAANILYEKGAKGINEFKKEMSKVTALDVAKQKMDNAAGAVEQMSGAFETMQIIAAEGTLPVVKEVALSIADSFEASAPKVERAGKRIGKSLERIMEPFTTKKPVYDIQRAKIDEGYIEEYHKELAKYTKFNSMDFGDKVVYSLDSATAEISKWVDGPGGQAFEKIFTKLAEISIKAYVNALTSLATGAGSQLMQGNFSSAAGLGLAAYALGGGALIRGGVGVGKWGYNKVKGMKGAGAPTRAAVQTVPAQTRANAGSLPTRSARLAATSTSRSANFIKGAGKVAGKVAMPVAVAMEGYNIYKSKDKVKATAQAGGGLAGGWGGATLGAAIGTAILPGIGTAIGGALGGLGGYLAGKFAAGKVVDHTRQAGQTPQTQPTQNKAINTAGLDESTKKLKSALDMNVHNFNTLGMYSGQASGWVVGSFMGIKTSSERVKTNLDILTMYTGQASGWMVSLMGIQTAGQRVVKALEKLEAKINSIDVPSPKSKRLSFDG